MFLRLLKGFFLKRKLKNSFANVRPEQVSGPVRTVGLLLDETYVGWREGITGALVSKGIGPEAITVLAFRDRVRKNERFDHPVFSMKDVSWTGSIDRAEVGDFTDRPFDLLISYYDVEKAPLLLVTQQSKAAFKVGFSTVDKRLNHFTIATVAEQYQVFVDELFRYLKILNKI